MPHQPEIIRAMAAASPSGSPVPPAVGMVLAERFRLEQSLGTGGMAEVFRATDLTTGRVVAIKVLRQQLAENKEAVQRFRREGAVLASLRNPAVVGIEAVHEFGDRVFIVMELLEGETLGARMKRGPMSARELAPIVAGCAAGLAAAHTNGVVHRDLKPDNIFLARIPGTNDVQVKVLDFGVSKVRGEDKLTQTGQVLGTPRYMSPEQLGAEPDIDPRVDVYGLGVILYEALSGGKSPFMATTPTDLIVAILNGKVVPLRSVKPDVPAALEAVVLRAMAKVRDARYANTTELAEAFFEAGDVRRKPEPKKQLGTSALGSMKTAALHGIGGLPGLTGVGDPAPQEGALAQGTFSELPAFDMRPPDRGTLEPRSDVGGESALSRLSNPGVPLPNPSPRVIPPTALSPAVVLTPDPAVGPTVPAADPAIAGTRPRGLDRGLDRGFDRGETSRHAPPRESAVPEPVVAPSMPSGLTLILFGLLAGGLAAGAVIAVLTWIQQARGSLPAAPPPPPPSAVAVSADAGVVDASAALTAAGTLTPATEADREREPVAEHTPDAVPEPATEPLPDPVADPDPALDHPTDPAPDPDPTPDPTPDPDRPHGNPTHADPEDPPVDPLVAATRALERGDAAECVDILDDVIARGGNPIALRRRADCLARLGDVREAIRDYRRFCSLVPDHPAIADVREILEGLGQTCP